MKMVDTLARRGHEVLAAIDRHWQAAGYAPSVRDLAHDVEVSLGTMTYWLSKLAESGFILRQGRTPRSLRLTPAGRALLCDTS